MAESTVGKKVASGRVDVLSRHVTGATRGERRDVAPEACFGDDEAQALPGADVEGAKFAAINAMRTGNAARDMATALIVPIVFKAVFDSAALLKPIRDQIMTYFLSPPRHVCRRVIKVEMVRNSWGYSFTDDDSRNTVLTKAMTLYMAKLDLKYWNADVNLVSIKANRYDSSDGEGDDDDDEEKPSGRSEVGQLKKNYRLARAPPVGTWVNVDKELGVEFMMGTEEEDEGDKERKTNKKTTTMTFQADSELAVDAFIDKAYQWYLDELKGMQKTGRYMYELISTPGAAAKSGGDGEDGGGGGDALRKYRRYKLSEEKTFASLFFPEKEMLLKLVADFKGRLGKYAIPGYPHKLGLLCHGPPGTGKTSLIKALANHTKRSIVNVPLARIATNAELMEVMFDNRYLVVGQEIPIKLRFRDIIFVMEDVDAISKIVHRRDGKDGEVAPPKRSPPKAPSADDSEDDDKPSHENGKGGDGVKAVGSEGSDKKKGKKKGGAAAKAKADDQAKDADKDKDDKKDEAGDETEKDAADRTPSGVDDEKAAPVDAAAGILSLLTGGMSGAAAGPSSSGVSSAASDRLNLSGILNALDGVVDAPNRILVMTTNHPEKLDPALIRPGRVDKKLLLSYMCGEQCGLMVQHYFQLTLAEDQKQRICELVDGGGQAKASLDITPARLEQLCAEHDAVDGLCGALQELSGCGPASRRRPLLARQTSVSVETVLNAPLMRAATEATGGVRRW